MSEQRTIQRLVFIERERDDVQAVILRYDADWIRNSVETTVEELV